MVFHMFSMVIPWKAVKYSGPERSTRGIRIVSIYGQQWTNTKRSARRDQLMSSAICGPPRNAQNAVARMSRVTFGPPATTPNGRYICPRNKVRHSTYVLWYARLPLPVRLIPNTQTM